MKKYLFILAFALLGISAFCQKKEVDTTKRDSMTMQIPVEWSDSTRTTIGLYYHSIPEPRYYSINWKKVKTFNDLKTIMQAFNISFGKGATNFNKIKKYLIIAK